MIVITEFDCSMKRLNFNWWNNVIYYNANQKHHGREPLCLKHSRWLYFFTITNLKWFCSKVRSDFHYHFSYFVQLQSIFKAYILKKIHFQKFVETRKNPSIRPPVFHAGSKMPPIFFERPPWSFQQWRNIIWRNQATPPPATAWRWGLI